MDHHDHATGHARFLDLDAEVFAGQLADVLDLAAVPAPREVVDLGAGSGAGARLLRERHPDAALTCVDHDPAMLDLLRAQGFAVLDADLDRGFPPLPVPGAAPDLVWAASSLHHVTGPARLLSGVREALAPGGTLVVVELAGLPRFLVGAQEVSLERRCHAVAAAAGMNHHPDWTPVIAAAGFRVSRAELSTLAPVTPAAREYALGWLSRFAGLEGLTAHERGALEDLLRRGDDLELEPRATRTVWVATVDPEA